jgi:acyl carrier protein
MEIEGVKQGLRAHIVAKYKIAPDDADFTDDVHLFDYGYIDSFGAVDLINHVQTTYGIEISQADLTAYPLNTVNEISTFVVLRKQGEL